MLRWSARGIPRFTVSVARCFTTDDIEETLRKAEEGKLDHKVKVPRLASRAKHVASLEHARGAQQDPMQMKDKFIEEEGEDTLTDFSSGKTSYLNPSGPTDTPANQAAKRAKETRMLLEKYHEKDHLYYWKEADYDPMDSADVDEDDADVGVLLKKSPPVKLISDEPIDDQDEQTMVVGGEPEAPIEDAPNTYSNEDLDVIMKNANRSGEQGDVSEWARNNDVVTMLSDDYYEKKFENYTIEDLEERNRKMNTIKHGIDLLDPDPQMRFECESYNDEPHPNMKREPKAYFPKDRLQPPREFVEKYRRFLFVTGLPPVTIDGKSNVKDATHQMMVRRAIVENLGKDIDSSQVFATDASSGFIGFETEIDVAKRLVKDPKHPYSTKNMTLGIVGDSAGFGAEGTVLKLQNIPKAKHTPKSLLRELFPPKDSNEGAAFEGLKEDDIKFISASKALIRFKTVEEAVNASNSPYVKQQMDRLSQYPLQIFRARRELVHKGYGAYPFHEEERKLGYRLIVDSDMPTRPFYISHAGVIRLVNLDPSLSPYQVSNVFQPFCTTRRDTIGSLEIIRCERGHPTGDAYIGFDLPGEAEAAMQGLSSAALIGDRKTRLQLLKDRRYPLEKVVPMERRPDRTVEELDRDLNDWEQFVDPKDIQILADAGIRKEVLDDALLAMRRGNPTFGPLDAGMRDEAIKPELERGQMWADIVRLYIEELKDCLAMPDNLDSIPPLYKGLHFPDEELDMSVFDQEKKRLEDQARFRAENGGSSSWTVP